MSIESFIGAMPKVEIGLRLEGAIHTDTLKLIAEQNDVPYQFKHYAQWVRQFEQPDFGKLDELFATVSQWLQQPEDLSRVVYELGVSLAKQNVRYAEIGINPLLYIGNHMTFEQLLSAVNDGRSRVERGWNVQLNWILNISRDQHQKAEDIVRWATSSAARKGGVVGLGVVGNDNVPSANLFERSLHTAQKKDTPCLVEMFKLADTIEDVLETVTPTRLVIGPQPLDDESGIKLLVDKSVPVQACIAYAIRTGQVSQYSNYPLRQLYDDGLLLTVGTIMPSLLGTNLTQEYLEMTKQGGFSVGEVFEFNLNAVKMSFASDDVKASLLAEFDSVLAELTEEHSVNKDSVLS